MGLSTSFHLHQRLRPSIAATQTHEAPYISTPDFRTLSPFWHDSYHARLEPLRPCTPIFRNSTSPSIFFLISPDFNSSTSQADQINRPWRKRASAEASQTAEDPAKDTSSNGSAFSSTPSCFHASAYTTPGWKLTICSFSGSKLLAICWIVRAPAFLVRP